MRKTILGLLIVTNLFFASLILVPQTVSAATKAACEGASGIEVLPKWYKFLNPTYNAATQGCDLSPGFPENIPLILLAVVEILLRIAGILAVIFVIYGGFQYLTSTGEPDKAKSGRTTIINALVGMMIAILATTIVNLVGRNIA